MPTNEEVIAAINSERDYQDQRWGTDGIVHKHTAAAWLTYIGEYHAECVHLITRHSGVASALVPLRKIAALAAAYWEEHVGPRETLYEIALRHGVEFAELEQALCDMESHMRLAKQDHRHDVSPEFREVFVLAFRAMVKFGAPMREQLPSDDEMQAMIDEVRKNREAAQTESQPAGEQKPESDPDGGTVADITWEGEGGAAKPEPTDEGVEEQTAGMPHVDAETAKAQAKAT